MKNMVYSHKVICVLTINHWTTMVEAGADVV